MSSAQDIEYMVRHFYSWKAPFPASLHEVIMAPSCCSADLLSGRARKRTISYRRISITRIRYEKSFVQ